MPPKNTKTHVKKNEIAQNETRHPQHLNTDRYVLHKHNVIHHYTYVKIVSYYYVPR